ncbi:hypothetical protein M422DRAFT_68425 [Sphaerobolus stellatus SS14]|uniref:Cyanovirin-N domain-containing protein n=1 Tax=Sphaerobolus stellatus (strain SS14) TaxID=990650 RepID=A0A0C9VHQ0_SPHS4|nr:hypothetical protein M422DRAFT_68425 [Sphaerobolus stellatus SS14]
MSKEFSNSFSIPVLDSSGSFRNPLQPPFRPFTSSSLVHLTTPLKEMPITKTESRAGSPNTSKIIKTNGAQAVKPELVRSATESSVSSEASSIFASRSSTGSIGSDTETTMSAFSATTTTMEYSSSTKVMKTALAEACFNLKFEGGLLWADCIQWDATETRKRLSFAINEYIGNIDGQLVWDGKSKNFVASCKSIEIKDGYWLVAECKRAGNTNEYVWSKFDLRTKLRNDHGRIVEIVFDAKLSKMLTEVPWMKFKVIAEPDLSIFAGHPVIKDTMVKIAQSTVQHVTMQMSLRLQAAIELAIKEVTISAIQYIHTEMDMVVRETTGVGAAQVHASCTGGQYLHEMKYDDLSSLKEIIPRTTY